MPRLKVYILIKCCIALAISILGGTLLWNRSLPQETHHTVTFLIQLTTGIDSVDIPVSKGVSRLQASIQCMQDIIIAHPQYTFGLITQGKTLRYLLPPTQDTGILLHYVKSLLTDGSSGNFIPRSSGMKTAIGATPIIQLGGKPFSNDLSVQYVSGDLLSSCKEQDIDRASSTPHLSEGEQQGMVRGIVVLALLLLL